MRRIHTEEVPAPGGHYAQGVSHGGFLFVSGQLPTKSGGIEDETREVLDNVLAIVVAAGGEKSSIVKTTVYVADIALWDRVNAVYAEFFGLYRPARAIVPVKELHHGYQIEVEAVAALDA